MSKNIQNTGLIKQIIKGAVVGVFCTTIGVLFFALIVKLTSLSETAIKSVNQFIKIISIFLGALSSIKENKGLVKGVFLGVLYSLLVSLLFKVIGGGYSNFLGFILELIFCTIIGAISGVISVNAKNR